MLDLLIAAGQPTAYAYAPGSGPMTPTKKAAILTTPVPCGFWPGRGELTDRECR